MDFITHTLIGVGASRLLVDEKALRPQIGLAAMLGALLIDGDSWLYLVDPSWYGKYHRVLTHSIPSLVLHGFASAGIAWFIAKKWPRSRRFGWFTHDNLTCGEPPGLAGFRLFAFAAFLGAFLHPPMDAITGFGNVQPFWPLSDFDISLYAVTSFDAVIFGTTLVWHVLLRRLDLPRRREVLATSCYAAVVIVYVCGRLLFGERTFI